MKNTINVERAKKGISQKELAKKIDISQAGLHMIEKDKIDPRLGIAFKIVKFFGLEIDDVFKG